MKEINAKGLACPAPVLQTKAVMDEGDADTLKVIVDNEASMENVFRFLESSGYQVSVDKQGYDFFISGKLKTGVANGSEEPEFESPVKKDAEEHKIAVFCATDRIGFGDDELGLKLMISFIKTLKEMGPELWMIMLVNNGVKLAIEGSEVLSDLQEYEKSGVKILVCGTCLTYFDLMDKKQVGETTNMLDIVTAIQLAGKVINI